MIRTTSRAALVTVGATAVLALTACSSSGGKTTTADAGAGNAGKASTPAMKFAMITHAPQGDTFFDIIRKGADAAAGKDNVTYEYSASSNPSEQSKLIQAAIDKKPDGIAVSIPNTGAVKDVLAKATAAGIPVVMFNAGAKDWKSLGALMYYGQDESVAGEAAGKRLADEGAKKVLCVEQEQGQSQLEARCDGMAKGMTGGTVEKLYVEGTNMPDVQTKITGKLADKSIDRVVTLGAPFALTAVKSIKESGSSAKLATFDTNAQLVAALAAGDVQWAVDQQPYMQGYMAIDSLWFYKTNGNILGGGDIVLTGPSFVDKTNVDKVNEYAKRGTR
ncbi:MAG TPA: substrate-binding domain-containing protein [Intrasporangium sp.]|uniref:substrate-binding domain-containing protein n=1 Tax=Intrasporangium sp. TaxID=1925024 RepID=UPI002D77535E|nr:substrate-binding domain-containing protein [Intrasporangium sp.]HET7399659.1 substrate-binding domain-containing protein [Intrasporangium sp.]